MPSPKVATVAWLASLTLVNVIGCAIVWRYSLYTVRGQMLDTLALSGNDNGRDQVAGPLDSALNAISLASLVVVLGVIGAIAVARGRYSLAIMAVVMVLGSTLTTKILKEEVIARPDFGADLEWTGAGNSMPSGHAAAAAAFAVGLVMVLPPQARGVASLMGATYTAVVGVATLSSGWHRPSDVIAAFLIVGGWAAGAGLLLVLVQRRGAVVHPADKAGLSLVATGFGGVGLLVAGALTLLITFTRMTWPPDATSSDLRLIGYLGSVMAVAGAAYLMMALVLVAIHRVIPHAKRSAAPVSAAPTGVTE
jgi:membrane-associated phospholipid phosphatase